MTFCLKGSQNSHHCKKNAGKKMQISFDVNVFIYRTAIALFKNTYNGKTPVRDAWKALTEKERKKFGNKVKKMKTKYISEFEVFLKSLSKEEIKAYKKHRKEVEERAAAALEKSSESSEIDSDSSET